VREREGERERERERGKQLWDQTQFFSNDLDKVATTPSLIQRRKEECWLFPKRLPILIMFTKAAFIQNKQ